jgi:hypothetical protein
MTVPPGAERFHPHAHLRVTPHASADSYGLPRISTQEMLASHYGPAQRLAEEMTVRRTRIQRRRARREHDWCEALPPDLRDPDIVRAKALARHGTPRRQPTGRPVTVLSRPEVPGAA